MLAHGLKLVYKLILSQAWYDGEEDEQMACGHGATEQAAIEDLVMNYPRWED